MSKRAKHRRAVLAQAQVKRDKEIGELVDELAVALAVVADSLVDSDHESVAHLAEASRVVAKLRILLDEPFGGGPTGCP